MALKMRKQLPFIYVEIFFSFLRPKNHLTKSYQICLIIFSFTLRTIPLQALLGFSNTLGCILLIGAPRLCSRSGGLVLRCWMWFPGKEQAGWGGGQSCNFSELPQTILSPWNTGHIWGYKEISIETKIDVFCHNIHRMSFVQNHSESAAKLWIVVESQIIMK